MKRPVSLLLCAALVLSLTACRRPVPAAPTAAPVQTPSPAPTAAPTPQPTPEPFRFTRDTLPVLDGSTATVPLGQAVAAVLLGESQESAADLIDFHKTPYAYDRLTDGLAELILVAEGGQDSYDYRDQKGKSWRMEPIAAETLVFFVNAGNPVDDLTLDQVRDIYAGKITNWSQVGGNNSPIQAYQRPKTGGSQAIMDKEIMGDVPMMEPTNADYVVSSMEGIIEAVRSWDNRPDALGYTVYYYADDMGMTDGLKLLSIDGVVPNDATIRSGEYPIHTAYYAVMDAETPSDSPVSLLFDWLLSQEGQDLIARAGYVSLLEPSPTPAKGTGGLWTDWSRLEPVQSNAPIYTRRYPDFTDTVIPADDYGPLVPFAGSSLYTSGEWGGWESPLYGLVTLSGEVVTDPVFSQADYVVTATEDSPGAILLSRVLSDGDSPVSRFALCAGDGSWCTDFVYSYDWEMFFDKKAPEGCFPLLRDNSLVYLNAATGEEVLTLTSPFEADDPRNWELFLNADPAEDCTAYTDVDTSLCWIYRWSTGESFPAPEEVSTVSAFSQGLASAIIRRTDGDGNYLESLYGYLGPDGRWVLPPIYKSAWDFEEGAALVCTRDGIWQVISPSGDELLSLPKGYSLQWMDGGYSCFSSGGEYLLLTPQRELRTILFGSVPRSLGSGWVTWENGLGGWTLLSAKWGSHSLSYEPWTVSWPYVLGKPGDGSQWRLANLLSGDTLFLSAADCWLNFAADPITGEVYLTQYDPDSSTPFSSADLEGCLLALPSGSGAALIGGLVREQRDSFFSLTTRQGQTLFRWPLPPASD